jgi:nucleoside-diphosphate kinase
MIEQTLVLLKPDSVQRGIIGKIISRLEDVGLKIIAMKMVQASKELAEKHYFLDEEWAKKVFQKSKEATEKEGRKLKYKTHMELGKTVQGWNMSFLMEGPVVAMILEGPHAIEVIRKMVGHTEPKQALPGTIRGDFASLESYVVADKKERVTRNLIHASDSVESAKKEISLWFNEKETHKYKKDLDRHL